MVYGGAKPDCSTALPPGQKGTTTQRHVTSERPGPRRAQLKTKRRRSAAENPILTFHLSLAADSGFRIMDRDIKRTLTQRPWGDPRRQFFLVGSVNKSQQKRRVLFEIDKTLGTYGPRTATVEAYVERHNRGLQFDGSS